MATKRPKRPRDPNQLGKLIVDLSVGVVTDTQPAALDPAKEYARKGGLKGGKARATALTPQRRREIAKVAAQRRWSKDGDE